MARPRRAEQRLNSLGLHERELNEFLDRVEAGQAERSGKRVFSRWDYRRVAVQIILSQPGGTVAEARMACRNLSRGGMSLLHRAFIHPGTRCRLTLTDGRDREIGVDGTVVRCSHVAGMVHDIGVRFDREVDVRAVVQPDPMHEISAIERADAASLAGSILYAGDCPATIKILKHFLRHTQLRLRQAENPDDAIASVESGVGLVLCELYFGSHRAEDLIRRLSESQDQTVPLVILSADHSLATRKLLDQPGVSGFIAKPFSQDFLLRMITEFYRERAEHAPGVPGGKRADVKIVDELLPELDRFANQLEMAVAESAEPAGVYKTLMQIAGVSPVLGLSELATHAEMLAHASAQIEARELTRRAREIADMCREAAKRA